jgi:hypothetical protein
VRRDDRTHEKEREEIGMITTNTTKVRTKDDDGKRQVITTTTMKPGIVRVIRSVFPGFQKREANKIDPMVKFTTEDLDGLMRTMGYKRTVNAELVPAPVIKTPQPKPAKKVAARKRVKK